MDVDVDHYLVLGLPSGEEGAKLSVDDIKKIIQIKGSRVAPRQEAG
jgi:DnaJ family protein C protein 17